jgi:hypothetical protein
VWDQIARFIDSAVANPNSRDDVFASDELHSPPFYRYSFYPVGRADSWQP